MKSLKTLFVVFLAAATGFSACKSDDSPDNNTDTEISETAKTILGEADKSFIRGQAVNDSLSSVKKSENKNDRLKETGDKLEYSLKAGKTAYQVLYEFDLNGLYKISISAESPSKKDAEALEQDFINFFRKKYGDFKTEGKFTYKEMPEIKRSVEIARKGKKTELILKFFEP